MSELRCFIPGEPKPKGSKRAFVVKGKPVLVEANKDVKSWQLLIAEALNEYRDSSWPWKLPIEVSLLFRLARPKSVKRRWPHVKPDIDKLARTVLDALVNAGIIQDDAQVVILNLQKRYSSAPGVEIEMLERAEILREEIKQEPEPIADEHMKAIYDPAGDDYRVELWLQLEDAPAEDVPIHVLVFREFPQ